MDNHFEKSANVDKVDNHKSYTDLSTQFSKPFFLWFLGRKRVFHKPTAPTTTATSQILYILLIHVNKGVVHSYEINSQ